MKHHIKTLKHEDITESRKASSWFATHVPLQHALSVLGLALGRWEFPECSGTHKKAPLVYKK